MKKRIIGLNTIEFTFDGLEVVTFDIQKMSAANREYAPIFGMGHRLGDMAANKKSEAERREAILEGVTHYESGSADWDMRGGARVPQRNPIWVRLAEALGQSYEQVAARKIAEAEAEIAALTQHR